MEASQTCPRPTGNPALIKIDPSGRLTVMSVIERFLTHSRFLSGSTGWQSENHARMLQWIRPELGSLAFSELTKDRILKFYIFMRDQGVGPWTIVKTHTLMCLLGDLYEELSPGSENVVRKIKGLGRMFPKTAPTREINFLTPLELDKLITACTGAKNRLLRPLVQFLANTGTRRSEALNLQWSDIDRAAGFIHIRQSKSGKPRTIPLEAAAWDAIREINRKTGFIFTYQDGSRPHEDSFLRPLRTAARRVGIKKRIDLHTFRHSYGSNKIRLGWGLKKVSMLLGHSDISITSNVYTHLLDGDLRVRDDFRFSDDRSGPATQVVGKVSDKAHQAAQMAHTMTSALKDAPNGADSIERIISSFSEQIKAAHAKLNETARAEIQDDLKSSRKILHDLQEALKKTIRAPHMLRGPKKDPALKQDAESSQLGLSFDINKLREKNLVELSGFEPLTSSMPWKRSTN